MPFTVNRDAKSVSWKWTPKGPVSVGLGVLLIVFLGIGVYFLMVGVFFFILMAMLAVAALAVVGWLMTILKFASPKHWKRSQGMAPQVGKAFVKRQDGSVEFVRNNQDPEFWSLDRDNPIVSYRPVGRSMAFL